VGGKELKPTLKQKNMPKAIAQKPKNPSLRKN